MKKKIIIGVIVTLCILGVLVAFLMKKKVHVQSNELPLPEIAGGARGELGIDKNINESTLDKYLFRDDVVYRDMRMLEDPATYEKIGGDRYLSGYVDGFEVIPLPYIIPVEGLPEAVGDTYRGTTLFYNDNGTYLPNYTEAISIIENIFPRDKIIFLMCGGGGYAGMTKNFLVSLGYDETKIYNVGGYWYYNGDHKINVAIESGGHTQYQFDKVPYHEIDFTSLTKLGTYHVSKGEVTGLKINTSKITLEEGTSFRLNVIVLPNTAEDKTVMWESSDYDIATVTSDGVVKARRSGKATITAKTRNGKNVSCTVTVSKEEAKEHVKLDDISAERKIFDSYEPYQPYNDYYEFLSVTGISAASELAKSRYAEATEQVDEIHRKRLEIVNELLDEKKSFIILLDSAQCGTDEVYEYSATILDEKKYDYIYLGPYLYDRYSNGIHLNLDDYNGGSIIVVKDGKIYASFDPSVSSIKDISDAQHWLGKYIDL